MTHASTAGSPLAVDEALIRLSVGLETADDLVAELRRALNASGGDPTPARAAPRLPFAA